jgi:hypothetical protein
MLWHGYGNLMTGLYRRAAVMRTLLYRAVVDDDVHEIDLLFLFEMALQGSVINIPDVLLHKRVGGISWWLPPRSIRQSLSLHAAVGREYALRIRRSALSRWQKTLLFASLAGRWTLGLCSVNGPVMHSVIASIDPHRRLRGFLGRGRTTPAVSRENLPPR